MSRQVPERRVDPLDDGDWPRPLYARVLRLHYFHPSGMVCFVLLEGSIALGLLLALAEWVSWWGILLVPVVVALVVKVNDIVAGMMARSAAVVPEQERERFRREVTPAIGRAAVPPAPVPTRASPAGPGIYRSRTYQTSRPMDSEPVGPMDHPRQGPRGREWHRPGTDLPYGPGGEMPYGHEADLPYGQQAWRSSSGHPDEAEPAEWQAWQSAGRGYE